MSASQRMFVRLTVERSRRSRASATRRQSSARYDGEMPLMTTQRWTQTSKRQVSDRHNDDDDGQRLAGLCSTIDQPHTLLSK